MQLLFPSSLNRLLRLLLLWRRTGRFTENMSMLTIMAWSSWYNSASPVEIFIAVDIWCGYQLGHLLIIINYGNVIINRILLVVDIIVPLFSQSTSGSGWRRSTSAIAIGLDLTSCPMGGHFGRSWQLAPANHANVNKAWITSTVWITFTVDTNQPYLLLWAKKALSAATLTK